MVIDIIDRNIVRQPIYGDPYFILFDNGGGLVDSECANDITSIISTIKPYHDLTSLNANSYGALYLKNGELFFVDDSNVTKELEKSFIATSTDSANDMVAVPFVYKNEIFYSSGETYHQYNPFTSQDVALVIPYVGGQFPIGNELYLIGNPRQDAIASSTDYTLFGLSLSSGAVTTLATVHEPLFDGYSRTLNTLYLVDGIEGQGCFGASYERYDINKGNVESLGTVGSCKGESGYETTQAQEASIESEIEERLTSNVDSFALIKAGQITQATSDEKSKWQHIIDWQASAWSFATSTN